MLAARPGSEGLTLAAALERNSGRGANFDAIRLFAAMLVMFSHAFIVSTGQHERNFLPTAAGGVGFGEIAVFIFFATSGFLVARSWLNDPHAGRFFRKRALRIFPALAFTVLMLTFVAGPLLTTAPLADYFMARETWAFVGNILFQSQHGTLPGVFETAPFAGRVDQSLWTLGFEAVCYAAVAILGALRLLGSRSLLVLAFVLLVAGMTPGLRQSGDLGDAAFKLTLLAPHFLIGAAAAIAANRIVLDARIALAAAGALVLSFLFGGFLIVFALAGSYLVLFLGCSRLGALRHAGRFGDLSYGVFLWGWPIQQLVETTAPALGPIGNFLIALPVALAAAAVSWRLVEQPALALKDRGAETETAQLESEAGIPRGDAGRLCASGGSR
ncbi:MAG: acyltransferase [Parvularculaceae bacterium]|nr:acyltransferase [Parvularculaceae bacterium]